MIDFEQAWALLENAAAVGDNITKEEVIEGLRNGSFVLFTRNESAALAAHCDGFLRIGLAGGNMDEMVEIEEEIKDYATDCGYSFVEIIGRPGWERALEGYDKVAVVLRKEI